MDLRTASVRAIDMQDLTDLRVPFRMLLLGNETRRRFEVGGAFDRTCLRLLLP